MTETTTTSIVRTIEGINGTLALVASGEYIHAWESCTSLAFTRRDFEAIVDRIEHELTKQGTGVLSLSVYEQTIVGELNPIRGATSSRLYMPLAVKTSQEDGETPMLAVGTPGDYYEDEWPLAQFLEEARATIAS